MRDERIKYKYVTDDGEPYHIISMKLDKINTQMTDGKSEQEAAENGISLLIDLCDILFDENQAYEKLLKQARRDTDRANKRRKKALDKIKELRALNFKKIEEFCDKRLCVFSDSRHEREQLLRNECKRLKDQHEEDLEIIEAAERYVRGHDLDQKYRSGSMFDKCDCILCNALAKQRKE